MKDNQKEMWMDYSKGISIEHIIKSYNTPTSFQTEFNLMLNKIVTENNLQSAIEIGCEAGISSMLLSKVLKKTTFLDYDYTILEKVEKACDVLNFQNTNCITEDMFTMNLIADETYDLAFNSGVIEHYTKEVREKAIRSYSRITKKGGFVIVAYPNHHSLPYRLSYLIGKKILGNKVWPWPNEFKFYSLEDEMRNVGLQYVSRVTMDRNTIFNQWITKYKLTRQFFLFLDKFMHFEGYLTVCVAKKP